MRFSEKKEETDITKRKAAHPFPFCTVSFILSEDLRTCFDPSFRIM